MMNEDAVVRILSSNWSDARIVETLRVMCGVKKEKTHAEDVRDRACLRRCHIYEDLSSRKDSTPISQAKYAFVYDRLSNEAAADAPMQEICDAFTVSDLFKDACIYEAFMAGRTLSYDDLFRAYDFGVGHLTHPTCARDMRVFYAPVNRAIKEQIAKREKADNAAQKFATNTTKTTEVA